VKHPHVKGRVLAEGGGKMKRVKEGEHGWGAFYTCMTMEHWNLSKSF
jgi:hypothetical protein